EMPMARPPVLFAVLLLVVACPAAPAQGVTPRATFKGHSDYLFGTGLSPDGKFLASCGTSSREGDKNRPRPPEQPRELKLWDAVTGEELACLTDACPTFSALVFSADGKLLATASPHGTAQLWDVARRKEITTLKGQLWFPVAFSQDSTKVACPSKHG